MTNEEGAQAEEKPKIEIEPAEEKPPEGISLLAQILVKAREDRKRREEEEVAKAKALAQKLIDDKVKQANSFRGRFKVFLKSFIIHPDSQFRAMWDLFITT